jgi:hypothetical protein
MHKNKRFSVFRFVVYLVAFTSLLLLRLLIAPGGESHAGDGGMWTWFGCVAFAAVGYMVYYAASEGHLRNLTGGVLVYLAIAAVVAACPPFLLLLAFWSITGLIKRRRALLMHALASIALFVLVFPMPLARLAGMPELAGAPAGIAYVMFALAYSAIASRRPLKVGMFRFATMLLAVPLISSFVALVGGGMLSRPERRRVRSTIRARRASPLALPAPNVVDAPTPTSTPAPAPVFAADGLAAALAMPMAVVAGAAAEVLMPAGLAAAE